MSMKITFKQGAYKLMTIPFEKLDGKYLTGYIWKELSKGGHGELIEKIVIDYLIKECGYTNIKVSDPGELWDFSLKNNCRSKIDVRRCGETVNLGHTSASLQKKNWICKATQLENGGYLVVAFQSNSLVLYYLSAKFLLDNLIANSNNVNITNINMCFDLDIPFLKKG